MIFLFALLRELSNDSLLNLSDLGLSYLQLGLQVSFLCSFERCQFTLLQKQHLGILNILCVIFSVLRAYGYTSINGLLQFLARLNQLDLQSIVFLDLVDLVTLLHLISQTLLRR